MSRERWLLVIVDPNNGFIEPINYTPQLVGGDMNLCVPNAKNDAQNLIDNLLKKGKDVWDEIDVTLDSHHPIHIAHPIYWVDKKGQHPRPFTIITKKDVEDGIWRTTKPYMQNIGLAYVTALESQGKYQLCIWPPHCIIGTEGHLVYKPIREALFDWEQNFGVVNFVTKGSNINTEHYSPLKAEVEDPRDPTTKLNIKLIREVETYDRIVGVGWARSHCFASMFRDLIAGFGNSAAAKKVTLVTDCTSDVPGFEHLGEAFVKDMIAEGVSFEDSKNII